MPTRQPSARYAWYVVAVLTLAYVSSFIDRQILALLVPAIKRDLGLTDTQVSYLLGLSFSVFYTLLGLPIARLADRSSRRRIMAVGTALWSVMTMACGLAGSFGRLLLTRIGVGVGEATLDAPSISLLADYFPPERLATAVSVYSLGIFLGSGLAYVIGGEIVGLVDVRGTWHWPLVGAIRPWQTVFILVGAPGLLVSLLMLTVREPVRRGGGGPPVPIREVAAYVGRHRRTFATFTLGFALSAMVNYGIAAWLATFLVRTYGWTASHAGKVQGVLTMTIGVAGALAGGRLADRLAARGRRDGPLRVGILGSVGMLVSASLYPLMPTAAASVAWLAVVNFFAALPWGAAMAGTAEIVPPEFRAQGAALYFFVLNLVSLAMGPTVVALATDYVFRDDALLRYSLVLVNVVGMSGATVLFVLGLPAFRRTVSELASRQSAADAPEARHAAART